MNSTPPVIGAINWLGMATLYKREVWRFFKVGNQTVLAPVVTTLLFLAVLTLAMGGQARVIDGIPYKEFIAPGLIMMAIVQNAFANTSSSLMLSKMQGVIVDLLMPPFKGWEITLSMVAGGITRGVCVGIAVTTAVYLFVPFAAPHPFYGIFYVITASMMLALMGLLTGIWSQGFDQLAAITNYIITPLAFLSGTFYSIKDLPPLWHALCHFNPFFYMIDGIRYAFTGYTDGSIATGMMVMAGTNIILWFFAQWLITRGYRLKT